MQQAAAAGINRWAWAVWLAPLPPPPSAQERPADSGIVQAVVWEGSKCWGLRKAAGEVPETRLEVGGWCPAKNPVAMKKAFYGPGVVELMALNDTELLFPYYMHFKNPTGLACQVS